MMISEIVYMTPAEVGRFMAEVNWARWWYGLGLFVEYGIPLLLLSFLFWFISGAWQGDQWRRR